MLQQVFDHPGRPARGGGTFQMGEFFLFRLDGCRDHPAYRVRECCNERVLGVQALTLVTDDGYAPAQHVGQRRAPDHSKEVFGAHLVLELEHLAVEHGHAGLHHQAGGALVALQCQLDTLGPLQRDGERILGSADTEAAGRIRANQCCRRRLPEADDVAAVVPVSGVSVQQLHRAPVQHFPQVDVVREELKQALTAA